MKKYNIVPMFHHDYLDLKCTKNKALRDVSMYLCQFNQRVLNFMALKFVCKISSHESYWITI